MEGGRWRRGAGKWRHPNFFDSLPKVAHVISQSILLFFGHSVLRLQTSKYTSEMSKNSRWISKNLFCEWSETSSTKPRGKKIQCNASCPGRLRGRYEIRGRLKGRYEMRVGGKVGRDGSRLRGRSGAGSAPSSPLLPLPPPHSLAALSNFLPNTAPSA